MTLPSRVRVSGPLTRYAKGFCEELATQGYTPLSAANQVRLMAHMSRWLDAQREGPEALTPVQVERFLRARRQQGYTAFLSKAGLAPLLGYLCTIGVVPAPQPPVAQTPLEHLLEHYRNYLEQERGLAASTVRFRLGEARSFLAQHTHGERLALDQLTAADVVRSVLRECRHRSVGYAQGLVTALRSLLRFLYLEGHTPTLLANAAPAIASWKLAPLPRAVEPRQVQALLRRCDRRTAIGRRDVAILTLLTRLGLRCGEVVALEIDDIDWSCGEITIDGKGRRHERLPLPPDVGEALVSYLRRGRPRTGSRKVFVRHRAPYGRLGPSAITGRLYQLCDRAGVGRISSHRLRHTAATQMLRHGAPLEEIAEVLRHRDLLTTATYAKVDREALRELARAWPGGDA